MKKVQILDVSGVHMSVIGYTGTLCDTNVDDCEQKSCPGGSCVDAVNMAFCRCPVGLTGDGCSEGKG